MSFVREKKVGNYRYFYLVQNKRVDGKVKQKTILCLGHCPTVTNAVTDLTRRAGSYRQYAASATRRANNPRGWREHRKVDYWKEYALKLLRKAEELERQIEILKPYL